MTCENECQSCDCLTDEEREYVEQANSMINSAFFIAESKQIRKLEEKFNEEYSDDPNADFELALLTYVAASRKIAFDASDVDLIREYTDALEFADYVRDVFESSEEDEQ